MKASFARRAWMPSPQFSSACGRGEGDRDAISQERAHSVVNARLSMLVSGRECRTPRHFPICVVESGGPWTRWLVSWR
jgi:hypothetical protein